MPQSYYFQNSGTTTNTGFITIGEASYLSDSISASVKQDGLNPILVFKYIKKKFGMLEKVSLDRRLKKLESAFYQAVENGQEALGNKILAEVARETRESTLFAKGIRHFIEREDIVRHKRNIKGGHISDTRFEDYTRVIPKDVLAEKKKYDGFFDGYIIYHYYNNELEQKREKKQKMSEEEKQKMRDPILFGYIKESDRLYFIADWEDEFCDLTFDEIIDIVGESKLTKYPTLNVLQ